MTGGQLNADVDRYRQAAAMNTPPPPIVSDPLVTGATPIEQLLRVLGIAANLGDDSDNARSTEQHAERDAKASEAAGKFAEQDRQAADELNGLAGEPTDFAAGPDQSAAMAQQLPALASSFAGTLAGAVGGALQPLAQIPQQVGQGLQQAVQTGMGVLQQATAGVAAPIDDAGLEMTPLTEDFGGGPADLAGLGDVGGANDGDMGGLGGGVGGAWGGAGAGGTAPTAFLGPPPLPSASTAPSSAPVTPVTPPSAVTPAPPQATGMAGMPIVPPGMGAVGADKDAKAETKRVSVPPVRNGAPVQGRLSTSPPLTPVTKKTDGKPLVTRRVVAPPSQPADQT